MGGERLCPAEHTSGWIEGLRLQVVQLSVASGDCDGLSDPEALQATAGFNLLSTDRYGWIELATNEEQLWVGAER